MSVTNTDKGAFFMNKEELEALASLNRFSLSEKETDAMQAFFKDRLKDRMALERVDTAGVEMTVHVMPTAHVLREDVPAADYSREEMQRGAYMTDRGYWCVPRVIE